MEYDSAMKTNVIVDITQINLEVNINKQKKKNSKKQNPKGCMLYASIYTIFSNGECKEMKGFPGTRGEDGVGGREVDVVIRNNMMGKKKSYIRNTCDQIAV